MMIETFKFIQALKKDDYRALEKLTELLEKQEPVPVSQGGANGLVTSPYLAYCPRCLEAADTEYMPNYCPECGQALDWSGYDPVLGGDE